MLLSAEGLTIVLAWKRGLCHEVGVCAALAWCYQGEAFIRIWPLAPTLLSVHEKCRVHAVTQQLPRLAVEPLHLPGPLSAALGQSAVNLLTASPKMNCQLTQSLGHCLGLTLGFFERLLYSGTHPNSPCPCPRDQTGLVGDELRALLLADLPASKLKSLSLVFSHLASWSNLDLC